MPQVKGFHINRGKSRSKKTKKRLAIKKEMLASRKTKKK